MSDTNKHTDTQKLVASVMITLLVSLVYLEKDICLYDVMILRESYKKAVLLNAPEAQLKSDEMAACVSIDRSVENFQFQI